MIATYRRRRHDEGVGAINQVGETEPDRAVVELLAEPFRSVEDTAERLARAEKHLRERDDRRSVFLTVYARMTSAVAENIQSGFFIDPDWVREYLVTFAEYYRRAIVAFERREFETVPAPWRIGFGASIRGDTLVAQDALLGINAHINYDLTYALREVSLDPDREAKRTDHDRINEILGRLIDTVQETLVAVYSAAGVAGVDVLLGPIDEQLAVLGFEQSRRFAWRNAVLLTDLSWRVVREYVDWRVSTVSTGGAHLILAPRIDPSTHRVLRNAESEGRTLTAFHDEFTSRGSTRVR